MSKNVFNNPKSYHPPAPIGIPMYITLGISLVDGNFLSKLKRNQTCNVRTCFFLLLISKPIINIFHIHNCTAHTVLANASAAFHSGGISSLDNSSPTTPSLGCCQPLTIKTDMTMNAHVHLFSQDKILPRSGLTSSNDAHAF